MYIASNKKQSRATIGHHRFDLGDFLVKTKSGKIFLHRSNTKKKKKNRDLRQRRKKTSPILNGLSLADGKRDYGISFADAIGKRNYEIPFADGQRDHGLTFTDGEKDYGLTFTDGERDYGLNLTNQRYDGVDVSSTSSRYKAGCGKMRIRRNVNNLTKAETERLVSAINDLIRRGGYVEVANIHGSPKVICPPISCCPHRANRDNPGNLKFMPWHRLYMAQMEEELGEPLPYWDWTENQEIPDLWKNIKEGLQNKRELETSCRCTIVIVVIL